MVLQLELLQEQSGNDDYGGVQVGSVWTYKYKNHIIVVKNEKTTELYVDDNLLDSISGVHLKIELNGKLDSGEEIKARLGGLIDVECLLSIDNVIQDPIEIV